MWNNPLIITRWIITLACLLLITATPGCSDSGTDDTSPTNADANVSQTGDASSQALTIPTWQLEDIQPESERHTQTYGLEAFSGKVVVVVLLQGWCAYCQSQATELEVLQTELTNEGVDAQIVAINGVTSNTPEHQAALVRTTDADGNDVPRCTFPVFQDTEAVNAWGQHDGAKDDFFIYRPDGTLSVALPPSAGTNLSTPDGRETVKNAIVTAAMDASP